MQSLLRAEAIRVRIKNSTVFSLIDSILSPVPMLLRQASELIKRMGEHQESMSSAFAEARTQSIQKILEVGNRLLVSTLC